MAIKKSDLYSSLWASCDALRGGMDASQYKDYVLFMLFIKYISDKYGDSDDFAPPVTIPKGASFKDMIALKGKSDIGDKINTQVIQPLVDANSRLARTDFPDFNDPNKLGEGKDMVDTLTNLIAIFQKPELDFSKNRADHDDILGDAYEYLMRHFATESGKSKGQFYTPSEVSRVIAKVIGISAQNAVASTTAYDPTCGSGSLLLKVAAEAGKHITLEGQEKDVTTAGLARMNMILHDFPTASILSGNTLAAPKFKDGQQLRTYDYVVANPPFSDKTWSTGLTPSADPFQRFQWGEPPAKQGDYAYLLHIIRSLKSTGKGACILPHGVLFRGGAEAVIRTELVKSGYLKGIIGLPANLFYGTGIPACIVVLDKSNAAARKGVFMIDASKGFIKDGNKNRLRERDIHRIVDVFTHAETHAGYSRLVPRDEIAKNDFNLNLPRYIDTQEAEDIQDIGGHLHGGIPTRDIDAFADYWTICPELRAALFKPNRPGYDDLVVEADQIKATIHGHQQFAAFIAGLEAHFATWRKEATISLRQLKLTCLPKEVIHEQSERLLTHVEGQRLIDPYAIYQHLMDYWAETMQDDCYIIAADGWVARPIRILETDKKGKTRDKGWTCDLVPKQLIVDRYFAKEQAAIDAQQVALEAATAGLAELEEEHGGEDGVLGTVDKFAKAEISVRLREIKDDKEAKGEIAVLQQWLKLNSDAADLKRAIREAEVALDKLAYDKYPELTEDEVRGLVVDDKWLTAIASGIQDELDQVSQSLTDRIRQLAERYSAPLPKILEEVTLLSSRVDELLNRWGSSHEAAGMLNPLGLIESSDQTTPSYETTEIGVIPPDWKVPKIEAILDEISMGPFGSDIKVSNFISEGIPVLNGANVASERLKDSFENFVTPAKAKSLKKAVARRGDVVVTHRGTIGQISYIPNDSEFDRYVISQSQFRARFSQDYVIPAWVVLYFHSDIGAKKLLEGKGHTGVPAIAQPTKTFRNLSIPLPPLSEQRVIVDALSDMDALLRALERLGSKQHALRLGMMQELLTGRTRLVSSELAHA